MAKKIYYLADNPEVDNRVDTTRLGYIPSTIPYGAGNTFVGANPLDVILSVGDPTDPRNDNYNPNLITGVAPTPTFTGKASNVLEALERVKAMRAAKQAAIAKRAAISKAKRAAAAEQTRIRMKGNSLAGSPEAIAKAKATREMRGTTQAQVGSRVRQDNINKNFKKANVTKIKGTPISTSSAKGSYYNRRTLTANDLENIVLE